MALLLLLLLPPLIDMPLRGLTKLGFTMWPLLPRLLDEPLLDEEGHWKLLLLVVLLLGDEAAFNRDDAGMNSGDWGVTWDEVECVN